MSCLSHNKSISGDPSNTRDIRDAFIREIRRRFRELRGVIRRTVGYEEDAFGLAQNKIESGGPYDYPTDQEKIQAFMRDVKEWINDNLLEPVGFGPTRDGQHWTGQYVRGAYQRGWSTGEGRLRNLGVAVGESAVEDVFTVPVAVNQLRKLYIRTFEDLRNVTDDMAGVIREELTLGLADGLNPRDIAKNITDELDTIQKTRAEVIARSEVIHSHSEGALSRYERAGENIVSHTEWQITPDNRVCAFCRRMAGVELTTSEMRNTWVRWRGQVYRLMPNAHPNGRCSPLPVVGGEPPDTPLSERVPGTIIQAPDFA